MGYVEDETGYIILAYFIFNDVIGNFLKVCLNFDDVHLRI